MTKSGRKRREEIKAQRRSHRLKRHPLEAKPASAPRSLGNVPVNEGALAPYNSYGAPSFVMRAAITRMFLFAVRVVAKTRSGPRHNKSGGMRSRRVTFILRRSSAGRAGTKSKPVAPNRDAFILKELRGRKRRVPQSTNGKNIAAEYDAFHSTVSSEHLVTTIVSRCILRFCRRFARKKVTDTLIFSG